MGSGDLSKIAHQHGPKKVLEVIEGQQVNESGDPLSGFFPVVSELDPNAKPKPTIRVPGEGWTLSEFARDLGHILREQNFFNLRGKCVRIEFDPEIGAYRLIETNPQEFRSLVERFCWPVVIRTLEKDGCKKEHFQVKRSLPNDISKATLASLQFLESLRPIVALNTVRLPALRSNGAIELLPEGYDPESQVFTVSPGVHYNEELSCHSDPRSSRCSVPQRAA